MIRKISWVFLLLLGLAVFVGCGRIGDVIGALANNRFVFPEQITWEKDGSKMALIPASYFEMGSSFGNHTLHRVDLDAFYMDIHEVTVGQYKQFLSATGHRQPDWDKVNKYSPTDQHPMVFVPWWQAMAYAEWVGKRLPTEAEWEYAARGGLVGKRFPWGDDEEVARDYANYRGTGGKDKWGRTTAPVGSFKPNDYGLFDMSGNVWEWCQDWYDRSQTKRALRSSSWGFDIHVIHVTSSCFSAAGKDDSCGFRCVSGLN